MTEIGYRPPRVPRSAKKLGIDWVDDSQSAFNIDGDNVMDVQKHVTLQDLTRSW